MLIAHGFHNPKRMPSFDAAFPGEARAAETPDQMMAAMMQWTAVLGRAEKGAV